MTPEEKALLEESQKLVKELRDKYEEFKGGFISKGDWATFEQKIWARMDQIEVKINRPPVLAMAEAKTEKSAEHKALMTLCRKGQVNAEEQKVLRIADDSAGGYLSSPEITSDLLKTVVEFSDVRSLANVRPTSKTEVWVRKRTGTFAARHVGELGAKTETTGLKFGMEKIPNHELYADVVVSNQDLEDSDFNLEQILAEEFGEQFGVTEGQDFIYGDGIQKAEGFLVNKDVLAGKIAGDTSGDVSVTDILNTYYGIKETHARNATWLLRRATVQKVVLFKDSANHYIWMPSLAVSMPSTILGRPIKECPDMPAVAANAYAVAFGDFRRGYTISDRKQISIIRDPYSQKNYGAVEFTAMKRVGGQTVQAEAIKVLQIKA